MNGCRYEQDVMREAWSDSLRAHVADCDECTATASAAAWMNRFAAIDDREHPLPNPQIVWLKAQVLQQSKTVDRAARPITIAQLVAYFVIASGWASLLTWKWHAVGAWLASMTPTRIGVAGASPLTGSFVFSLVLLLSATAVLALHTILAEE